MENPVKSHLGRNEVETPGKSNLREKLSGKPWEITPGGEIKWKSLGNHTWENPVKSHLGRNKVETLGNHTWGEMK